MFQWIINRQLDQAERDLGAPVDYLRHLARVSFGGFLRVLLFSPLASYRSRLPAPPYHMGRLAAVLVEDCGSCVQIEVNLARKAGIPVEYLKAALAGDVDRLPGELADAYRFARAVAADKGGEEEYRNRLQKHFGEEGVAELATGIAAARVYPALKRGLGYAVSCSRLPVDV